MKQSFSWWCFADRGVEDAVLLKEAKNIGYEAVELIQPDKFQMALDHGLKIASHNGHQSIGEGLNDMKNHDSIEQELLASLELATKYEIPNLIVFSGNRRPGLSEQEGLENTAAGLRRVAPAAEQAGVMLIIELLNSKVDHAGYQCDHTQWAADMIEAVGSPNVKMLYDIYHMQIMEGDLIRTIQTFAPQIGHYHTAGNPGRHDLDETQEIFYPPLFRAIAQTGYDGCIAHEFLPKGEPIGALRCAFELCKNSLRLE